MQKVKLFLLAMSFSSLIVAQRRATIEPSGNVVTKDVSVKPFEAIEASGLYEMVLTEGDKEGVKIEADDNLQNLFSVSNNGNKLVIEMPELKNHDINYKNKKERRNAKLKVFVTYKKLKSLDLSVVGNVSSESTMKSEDFEILSKAVGNINLQIATNKLKITNKGVGNITLKGTATDAAVANAGVGRFNGEDLLVQTMDIDNSGVGGADVNVEKQLKVKQSFLGKVRNKGTAKSSKGEGVVI